MPILVMFSFWGVLFGTFRVLPRPGFFGGPLAWGNERSVRGIE